MNSALAVATATASYVDYLSVDSPTERVSSDRWGAWSQLDSSSVFEGAEDGDADSSSMNTLVQAESTLNENTAMSESGISDTTSVYPVLERAKLNVQCQHLVERLKGIVTDVSNYYVAVRTAESAEDYRVLSRDLIHTLRPSLIRIDEVVVSRQAVIRKNLDRCHISDRSVRWLLQYNNFFMKVRQIIAKLTLDITDELDHVITLKIRGCGKVVMQRDLQQEMEAIVNLVRKLDIEIFKNPNNAESE